jgi:hypothetical protein
MLATSNLIVDCVPFKIEGKVITEDRNGIKVLKLKSLVQRADFLNENGRYYPTEVITEAVHELQSNINMRSVLGELTHPDDAVIHIDNACVLLSKLWMENKKVYGEFEVLEKMPKGSMLKSLIEQNVSLFISSRGVGDMETCIKEGNEYDKVLPGFKFVTFDVVIDPSVKGTKLSISESKAKNKKVVFEQKLLDTLKKTLI